MAQITEVYKKYKILPALQEHHFRVAAVAQQICDSLTRQTNKNAILAACLIHDMGNIIKFDLSKFPQYLKPQGKEYWQKVQAEYISKYGSDEHKASLQIVHELNVDPIVIKYVDRIGFTLAAKNQKTGDINVKICAYSDMRVGPHGVMLLRSRLNEGRKRYKDHKGSSLGSDAFSDLAESLESIEREIFQNSHIRPENITDRSIEPIVNQLRTYEI